MVNYLIFIFTFNSLILGSFFLKLTQNDINKITEFDNTCSTCFATLSTKKLYKITCPSKIPHIFCKECSRILTNHHAFDKKCPCCRANIKLIDPKIANLYEFLMRAYRKNLDIKRELSSMETSIDTPDSLGKTILMDICSNNKDLNLIRFLINHGANPDIQDHSYKTALMYACKNGEFEVAKLLIELKADTQVKDMDKKTAFMQIDDTTPNKQKLLKLFFQNNLNIKIKTYLQRLKKHKLQLIRKKRKRNLKRLARKSTKLFL